jgi:hypothetical protein
VTPIERLEAWRIADGRRFYTITSPSGPRDTWTVTLYRGCNDEDRSFRQHCGTLDLTATAAIAAEAKEIVRSPAVGPAALEPMTAKFTTGSCL